MLQSSPQDRRIIFEEAAGISKYKARKREAERKLERTQQNLLRVADIIEELEKRLRSVKLQAGKARNFQEYQVRLNDLRSTYAMAEYHRHTELLREVSREVEQCSDRATALRTDIDRIETQSTEGTLELDRCQGDIGQVDSRLIQTTSDIAAQTERVEAARHRVEEQQSLRTRVEERLAVDEQRVAVARNELADRQAAAGELQHRVEELHAGVDLLNERDCALARDLTQAQATLEDEKAGIIELLRRSAQTHNEIVRLSTQRESLVGQKGRLSERDARISVELQTAVEQKAQFERRVREVEALIVAETQKLEEKKQEARRVNELRQRLVDELAAAKENRSAMQSRRELLDDLQRNREGVGAGVRQLLDERATQSPSRLARSVACLVADVFETDVAHASIIEAVLAGADQDLIVEDGEVFLADPEAFERLAGRVTALCEDRVPPVLNPRDFSGFPGFVGRAIDLVRYPERYERIARHLFGKTLLVEDLASGLALSRVDVDGHTIVTRRGEVLSPEGRVSVGPVKAEAGLISRKSELRELQQLLVETDERIRTLADQLNRTEAEVGHLDAVQQELRTAIYESSTARVEANAAAQSIQEVVTRLTNEQPLIAHEVAMLEHQIRDVLDKSAAGGRTLEEMEAENESRERMVAQHQARIDEVVAARLHLQDQLTQAKVELGQLSEKRSATAQVIGNLDRAIHDLDSAVLQARSDLAQCEAKTADAVRTIAAGEELLRSLRTQVEDLENQAARLRTRRDELRTHLDGLAHSLKSLRSELVEVEARLHERQMTVAQATVRRDELVVRVQEELSVNLAQRYLKYQHQDQDWTTVETEIGELRAKIERLGNVNLDAIHELSELEERHGFLSGQKNDLEDSHRKLTQLIDLLNQESQERFRAAFDEIQANFRDLFRKLFGGGRADIVLEDPENVLDCGIEIVAQPPGKELRTISLMSGGEKSMTAIALLMSIFKTKPAPFAILDEVDAALDEANNDRFNRIVREFVTEAQFIVITHSKRTMSIGDRLYGITMQEPGVSTRVSVSLDDAQVA